MNDYESTAYGDWIRPEKPKEQPPIVHPQCIPLETVNVPEPVEDVIVKKVTTTLIGMGEFETVREYKRQEAKHTINWNGPRIKIAQWREVLAFLRWANDTYKTEAQVRGFVNGRTGEWKFWAFPQNITRTLATSELRNDDMREQEKQFNYTGGWRYYATVHGHCEAPAFQSGIDSHNEKTIDGIHFTIGHLHKDELDLHLRIAVNPQTYNIKDYTMFFEEPPCLAGLGPFFKKDTVSNLFKESILARPPKDHPFPEVWKTNMVDTTPKVVVPAQGVYNDKLEDEKNRTWDQTILTWRRSDGALWSRKDGMWVLGKKNEPKDLSVLKDPTHDHDYDYERFKEWIVEMQAVYKAETDELMQEFNDITDFQTDAFQFNMDNNIGTRHMEAMFIRYADEEEALEEMKQLEQMQKGDDYNAT